jgi:hypothetical protein
MTTFLTLRIDACSLAWARSNSSARMRMTNGLWAACTLVTCHAASRFVQHSFALSINHIVHVMSIILFTSP